MTAPEMLTTVPARASEMLERPASDLAHAGIISVPSSASIAFVARTMAEHDVHAVLVADATGRHGWVTSRGMLHNHARDWTRATAGDAITEPIATLPCDAMLRDALDAFLASGATHVLLVAPDGEPLSVLADSDLVRHMGGLA